MITGANTNVRHRGILFHVQTEDSGRANPHIISHLYHGGTILGSRKTDYREHLEADDLLGIVKELIDEQHSAMVAELKEGGFDAVIAERLGDTAAEAGFAAEPAPDSKPDTRPDSGPGVTSPPAPVFEPAQLSAAAEPDGDRAFGKDLAASKPLDEVILDYLCEKARARDGGPPGTEPADR